MATILVDLYESRANKTDCEQRCKRCPESWIVPRFTEDQFKKVIDRVIAKYWERKNQLCDDDADGNTLVDDDRHRGNLQAPHDQSLCRRCMKLGRPCW